MSGQLVFPIVAPLAATLLCQALRRAPRLQRLLSLAALASIVAYAAGWLWPGLRAAGVLTLRLGHWPPPHGIVLVADLFSGMMVSLATVVGVAVLLYGAAWLGGGKDEPLFYPLYLVLLTGMNGALLAGDLLSLLVSLEVLLLASFGLLALGRRRSEARGAMRYLAAGQASLGLCSLAAGLLFGAAGTLSMAGLARQLALAQAPPYAAVAAALLLAGLGMVAAVLPVFLWASAPEPSPTAPLTAPLGSLLAGAGIYALFRCCALLFPGLWAAQRGLLVGAALLAMLVGVAGALAQRSLRRLLACDAVGQAGFAVLGLGLATLPAMAAGIYFLIHLMLAQTAMALAAGLVERAAGTSGLLRRPGLAALLLVAALSLAGAPPTSGFVARYGLAVAGLHVRQLAPAAVVLAASGLTLYALLRAWTEAFLKPTPMPPGTGARLRPALMGAALSLVALTVVAAALAGPLMDLSQQAAAQLLNPAVYLRAVLGL